MIYQALTCLTEAVNDHFKLKLGTAEEKIVLSSLVNMDGSIAIPGDNKIVVTLVNMERETLQKLPQKRILSTPGSQNAPLQMNIYVLFAAYFSSKNYSDSLRFISFILAFFQSKNVFTKENTPNMSDKLEKISIEIVDMNMDSLSNFWSLHGGKYMPSVLYKIRLLHFDDSVVTEFRPVISHIDKQHNIK